MEDNPVDVFTDEELIHLLPYKITLFRIWKKISMPDIQQLEDIMTNQIPELKPFAQAAIWRLQFIDTGDWNYIKHILTSLIRNPCVHHILLYMFDHDEIKIEDAMNRFSFDCSSI